MYGSNVAFIMIFSTTHAHKTRALKHTYTHVTYTVHTHTQYIHTHTHTHTQNMQKSAVPFHLLYSRRCGRCIHVIAWVAVSNMDRNIVF